MRDLDEIRLPEFLAGLEGLIEDSAGQQVPHLAHDVPPLPVGFKDFRVEAVVGRALVAEEHLPLDFDRFQQTGADLLASRALGSGGPTAPAALVTGRELVRASNRTPLRDRVAVRIRRLANWYFR
jgi:hypothetical protein